MAQSHKVVKAAAIQLIHHVDARLIPPGLISLRNPTFYPRLHFCPFSSAHSPQPMATTSMACMSLHRSGGLLILVRAKPTGKRNRLVGISGPALEVELAAKPQNGEANAELIDYLSDILHVRKRDIELISGDKSRDKQLLVAPGLVDLAKATQLIETEFS